MSTQQTPTVLIAYPQAFLCYGKFERKISSILSNFSQFYIAYMADDNNFINKHLASDNRVNNALTSSIDEEHLSAITYAIIFNDGETFNQLIENANKSGIKSRIINTELTKVVNVDKGDAHDVYIGRGSDWGNPYAIGFDGDRDEVIRKYQYDFERDYLKSSKEDALSLRGKILGCHCKPAACHGDVIANYLNSLDDGK
ncbi:MAG TPA: DUF4326 domain-containing protein [Gammaproteobacteria bacterium]|nr:DUF4326 domain-containing protein [Gammaproteobacteria bacterium]